MVDFVLGRNTVRESKRTLNGEDCPIMIRTHIEGHHYQKAICACDVSLVKARIHPSRCGSLGECPARDYTRLQEQKLVPNKYPLLVLM